MKLRQFIHPLDPSFSTPKAARKLLHLFAFALVMVFYAGAYSYLSSTLNEEISLRRSYMNAAISDAQSFFISRQTLLKTLGLATVRNVTEPVTSVSAVSGEEVHISLGTGEQNWSLWLTRRMIDYLRHSKVNLLYVGEADHSKVVRLFTAREPVPEILPQLLARLRAAHIDYDVRSDDLWLTDQQRQGSPLYIFTRLDERSTQSGWLGLEVESPDLLSALQNENAGQFMLLDSEGQLIFDSAESRPPSVGLKQLPAPQSFGFVGRDWLPDHLAIRKQLGYSDWQIVYAIDVFSLLPVLIMPLLISLLLCGAMTWLMSWLVRRIDQRLIIPAGHRIEALVESEAFSRAVIQIAPVALCVVRRQDGEVVLENPLYQQWLGDSEERQQLCRDWIRCGFDELEQNSNDELQIANGRHLYLSFAPTRYKREDVLICAFSDISARKQVEMALDQARRMADTANEAKTLFLATMSHEIRTPLYGVLGTLELLARTELSEQQKSYLRAIEGSSANLLQLICDVLDVSRIEAGQLELESSRFSTLALIEDVIQGYAGAAQSKGLQLFACIDPQLPDWLNGDVTRIRQILNNLLNNALKFTDSGRIILRVRLESRDDERAMLHWQVSDTGKGISNDDQKHLFEPFYQAGGNTNVVAGTGLGLSICKRLMHLMNGTMRVVSEPGLGSSFTLRLPLEQLPAQGAQVFADELLPEIVYVVSPIRELAESICGWLRRWGARTQVGAPKATESLAGAVLLELHPGRLEAPLTPQWTGARVMAAGDIHGSDLRDEIGPVSFNCLRELHRAVSAAQGQSMQCMAQPVKSRPVFNLGIHILVAEDNVINQLILRDQLGELGCTVELANDGETALELWRNSSFDLILTDVNMPRMNGYELAIQLRHLDCSLPIIGATANAMREEGERCLEAGMNQCLIKPFALRTLYNCLEPYQRSGN
ncbi:sensor histidine kinase [Pseudomonas fluorescens HK44]|uniref:histidine kinase n=1 Tax=Pseudomonas fluorescens HK44 TaxID=1042209 RepID=A0A010TEH8_PSEFL|nr:ATP-binding protein [Pseudomonas fluorescens]EXF95612.1 sensor histidine kinase [Pseudomonas fluorescens HK44]